MNLQPNQQKELKTWLDLGLSLSQIQKNIQEKWHLSITYMDLRLLIDDLHLNFPEKKESQIKEVSTVLEEPSEEPLGKVSVDLDAIAAPGALVNGTVTFSDGEVCQWKLNQLGQLGLVPSKHGYKPSQEDLVEFQKALQAKLESRGF